MEHEPGERVEGVRKAMREEVRPALWHALEKDPSLASKIIAESFEKVLDIVVEGDERLRRRMEELDARLGKRIEELDERLGKRIEELTQADARLGKRIEELDERLTLRIEGLAEQVNKLVEVVRRHEGRMGDIEGMLIEHRIRPELEALCKRYGLKLRRGFVREWGREVDWIVEGPDIVALLEITKRATARKLAQVLEVARDYEAIFGRRPDGLFIYSREKPPDDVLRGAEGVVAISGDLARIIKAIASLSGAGRD